MQHIAAAAAGRAAGVSIAVAGMHRDQRAVQLPAPGGEREAEDAGAGSESPVKDDAMGTVGDVEVHDQRRRRR